MRSTLACLLLPIMAATPALAEESAPLQFTLNTDGGIKVANHDKSATFQLGGRLQFDYDATESKDNQLDTEDFDVRRARLYVKGHVGDWGYKAQFNIAESDGGKGGNAEDLYLSYLGFGKQAQITIGKQAEPFGLERLMSSKDISALERSAMTELHSPGRALGVKLHGVGSNWTYALGVFESDGDGGNDFEHKAMTGRFTYTPYQVGDAVIHLGASYTQRDADVSEDEVNGYGLELAASSGPLHLQAEYFGSEFGDEDLDGFYVQGGWVITGESRPYKQGNFGRVKPGNAYGAWELVLRLEQGDGNYGDIGLDKSTQVYDGNMYTLGVNYYADKNVRLGLNYSKGEAEDLLGNEFSGSELRARFQYAF
ncbi:OprO/OprP family phosphate-selective porin [Shewanella algae]|uniref:OprO/OprP family phosphate-selective porin n=1 Tax=Shewanella algae TaxID=38313 RepID=UPI001AAD82CD|nr:porin [Shewanella algae]MBO2672599.1 ATPase [Shewanella algae]